ncbi:MAG: lysophospholipid acyltransferase family protein [Anaerolineae bacterium]
MDIGNLIIPLILYGIAKVFIWCYVSVMMRMNIHFLAPLPSGPKIIAANHPSVSDPFIIANMLKHRSYILILGQIFEIAIAGAYLRRLGHIPVVEGSGQVALDRALALLKRGETVVIFPEGNISPAAGEFLEARTGVARLALASGAPVIPVGIHLREQNVHRFSKKWPNGDQPSAIYLRGPYYMTVGEVLRFEGDCEDRPLVRQVANDIMSQIISLASISASRMAVKNGKFSQQMA